jgi:hypothetical protein
VRQRSTGEQGAASLHVVPHTHWDREWYRSFESFRAQLIDLVDDLVRVLEDPAAGYRCFTFDGQVVPIDDYLEVRPEMEERVRALIAGGRIVIGPWYTLCDQFLVSGETILRSLESGLARARELGGSLEIGYCPDQFGQTAQLPQILRLAGIRRAIIRRGVPPVLARQRFRWRGLDGSELDCLFLQDGYGLGHLQDDPELAARWRREREADNPGEPLLVLAGDDHASVSHRLPERAGSLGGRLSTLDAFWTDQPPFGDAPLLEGELRSPGRHPILADVVSTRVDQRALTAAAERELERYGEPLATIAGLASAAPRLERAWRLLILNAAHDSACGCNIDEVCEAVRVRAREARDLAAGVAGHALRELGATIERPGRYVWNPSPFERDGVPPLGWAPLEPVGPAPGPAHDVGVRFVDQDDEGDTYTFDPRGGERPCELPVARERRPGEGFTRLRVEWENERGGHRLRMLIALPRRADQLWTDTAFGAVQRAPQPPEPRRGDADRVNGYPAARCAVAGGLALLVDRTAEVAVTPDGRELALTLLRATGMLSVEHAGTRPDQAGPALAVPGNQLLGPLAWEVAVMAWDGDGLPWREWEAFALPLRPFDAAGGGDRPDCWSPYPELPEGVLSAVLPDEVRTFDAGPPWRIRRARLQPSVCTGTS